ncbi:FAD/NAD(P)-binding domain-containing protein [Pleurostoma richardsiae]|uniref:FAD/NAD(P)-binding domain-containing protein n=1 Tax=Pleurostoma richardsiae TaxID=41990 RepID=A0AA38S5G2_9PEZI|nr:FAD/NAD(P)-binding domain-containing protein [Pleurostoma richardsiae]
MDAYSMTCASPSHRLTSRIYQDLKSSPYHTVAEVGPSQLFRNLKVLDMASKTGVPDKGSKPHIGIVGAGLAGLRCADILLQYGFQVTVIEGRNRVGGRLHQERLPNGFLADVGPNWIHGTDNNPILDLAKKTNTSTGSWDNRSYVFNEDGRLFQLEEGEYFSSIMWDIVQDAFKCSNEHTSHIDPQESLLDFFQRRIVELIPETKRDWERQRHIVLQMADLWGAFVGSPIEKQSLKFFWLEECIEGENLFCAGTYAKILREIAKPVVEGATIKYNTRAARIQTKAAPSEPSRIVTDSDDVLDFDEVVVTAPLGWLKKNTDAFEPPLPSRLAKAIDSIGYGCLEKVYISFPKAFWLVPDAEGRTVQGFCQWLSPNYDLNSNPKRWTHEVVELASLSEADSHPTLLFYIYGEESQHLTSAAAKLTTKEARDAFFYDFFRPYYSRLPHYDPASPDCRPAGCLATDWLHDELAGNGSYSNFQVGLREGDRDIRAMREGVPERGLWLAGEHTAPFVALGTATGAYWSGESVGRRIAEVYGRGEGVAETEGLKAWSSPAA